MDGNGRWARARGRARVWGHRAGARTVRAITTECARLGLPELTLYAFSSENWRRPRREVGLLMRLLLRHAVGERRTIMDNGVRLRTLGDLEALPVAVRREVERTVELSASNRGTVLRLALNYGGRAEIAAAARRIAERAVAGELAPAQVDEGAVAAHLHDPSMSDPDLVIRTAGEMRLSNFLLWQASYAEFWVTPVEWPDFRETHLHEAIREFRRRVRRYGGVVESQGPGG
ncbi:MAG: di-trans,poly-cis-decaprenylcistransferase [Planctomycetes bacterium]|nr:di-trans,poly-cis-decaprenylcistransferase [Planctomycetota bacterium]